MKKVTLTLTVALATSIILNAQNVNIPDTNFKAYLVGNSAININGDAEIQLNEAQSFTGTINCQNLNIADLTGIEAFSGATQLICSLNQLTSLDVSSNTALMTLTCGSNQLASLDVSSNAALTSLSCENNQLTFLDVSSNTALKILICRNNQLTSLDVSTNTELEAIDCGENLLTSLDISENVALETLGCGYNQLTTLNVSSNVVLTVLWCGHNQLTSLDVSSNTVLIRPGCENNQLTSLNVKNGNNINFIDFYADGNPNLTCIQVDDVTYATTNWTGGNFVFDVASSFSEDCSSSMSITDISGETQFTIYPNPTKHIINFPIQANIQLLNITGQIITDRKNINTLDLSEQPTGIYIIILTDNNGRVIKRTKIVKE